MRLLLTSGGVTNASIRRALIDMLGKPIEDCDALIIPTAQWGHPQCTPQTVWMTIADRWPGPPGLTGLGWRSVGVLELTALQSIGRDRWMPWVEAADVLLVDGGEALHLAHWLRETGLIEVVTAREDLVWVGVSGGSMALTPRIGRQFVDWRPDDGDAALGVVDFAVFPHLDFPGWSSNTSERAAEWAVEVGVPAFAIDDQSALAVVDGGVDVVSEGHWLSFGGAGAASRSG